MNNRSILDNRLGFGFSERLCRDKSTAKNYTKSYSRKIYKMAAKVEKYAMYASRLNHIRFKNFSFQKIYVKLVIRGFSGSLIANLKSKLVSKVVDTRWRIQYGGYNICRNQKNLTFKAKKSQILDLRAHPQNYGNIVV